MKWQKAHSCAPLSRFPLICQPEKVHSILLEPQEYPLFFQNDLSKDYPVLTLATTMLPYLSLQENLFLKSSVRKKDKKRLLLQWLPVFHWSRDLLSREVSALSTYERIKCQVLQFVFADQKNLLVADIFSALTVPQIQELLPLFQQITRQAQKQIIVVTSDPQIADNPYVDVKLIIKTNEKDEQTKR